VHMVNGVPSLVRAVACVCTWFFYVTRLENGFVDIITRAHGHSVFAQCLKVRPRSLLLHGPVFRSRSNYLPRMVSGYCRLGLPGGNGLVT